MIDLRFEEIEDPVIRENFQKLQRYLESLGLDRRRGQDQLAQGVSSDEVFLRIYVCAVGKKQLDEKKLTLLEKPFDPSKVFVEVNGGAHKVAGSDFTVVGRNISWRGLNLDAALVKGDVIRVTYFVE